jgi:hypothetical protein
MREKRDGDQQGAPLHGEGEHGDKTHQAIIESLQTRQPESESADGPPPGENDVDVYGEPLPGRHRLREHREQHDIAEKESEANRHERG